MQVDAKITFIMGNQTIIHWFCNNVEVEGSSDDERHIDTVQQLVELMRSEAPMAVSAMIIG